MIFHGFIWCSYEIVAVVVTTTVLLYVYSPTLSFAGTVRAGGKGSRQRNRGAGQLHLGALKSPFSEPWPCPVPGADSIPRCTNIQQGFQLVIRPVNPRAWILVSVLTINDFRGAGGHRGRRRSGPTLVRAQSIHGTFTFFLSGLLPIQLTWMPQADHLNKFICTSREEVTNLRPGQVFSGPYSRPHLSGK